MVMALTWAQSTCLTDEVYPFGHIRTQCGKKGAMVWGQEAPEQLTPGYNLVTHTPPHPTSPPRCLPPSTPKSLGPRSAPPQQHFSQAPPSRKREAPRRLAKRAGEGARSVLRYPSPQDRRTRQARALTFREQEEPHVTYPALPSLPRKLTYVVRSLVRMAPDHSLLYTLDPPHHLSPQNPGLLPGCRMN